MSNQKYDLGDIADNFNKKLKKLINTMNESDIVKNNILFETIQRRVSLIISKHPLFLLEEAGSQIFQYRDYIKNES